MKNVGHKAGTLAIIQPSFVPWRGYFDIIRRSDVFVFYDDVQYEKNSWRNRNKIKTAAGWQWITVPVLTKGRLTQAICEARINDAEPWRKKVLGSISQAYSKAPFFEDYFPLVARSVADCGESLSDLCIGLTQDVCARLGIRTTFLRSSSLGIGTELRGADRVLAICKALGAARYVSGPRAKSYLGDGADFEAAGVALEYMTYDYPEYPQLHGPFLPDMSILDLLFNCGDQAPRYIWDRPERP